MKQPIYSWSIDEEIYYGQHDTPENAAAEGFGDIPLGRQEVFVGENLDPDPVSFIDADLILEHITCQDEFSTEAAEQWTQSEEEKNDLTRRLRNAFNEWMEANNQVPGFWTVNHVKRYVKGPDGKPIPANF